VEQLTTVGIDLAKDVIAACVLDVHGAIIERRVLRRGAFERWAEQLPSCKVAMEACGSAHHWGRWFAAHGHTALLIAAEFVVPFRKGGKNDTVDAEAVAIAARQPTMRFVPIKTVDQQALLAWHSVRKGSNRVLSGGLYRGPRTSSSRNKAVCKDAVCSFVYRRARSHHLTTTMPPSAGPHQPMQLDSLREVLANRLDPKQPLGLLRIEWSTAANILLATGARRDPGRGRPGAEASGRMPTRSSGLLPRQAQ
jgi:hypothetical protein